MIRRTAALSAALALGGLLAACGGDSNTNSNASNANAARSNVNANATAGNANGVARDGVIDTNANISPNANSRSVPSNTAVVVNNNRNENTSGVSTMNGNRSGARNGNTNRP